MIKKSRITDFFGVNRLCVLCYHRIVPVSEAGFQTGSLINAPPDEFDRQVAFLKKRFNIISLEELSDRLASGFPFRPNSLLITFDDGYKDNYIYAYPVLKRHKVPAVIFIMTGLIDAGTLIWADRLAHAIENTTSRVCGHEEVGLFTIATKQEKDRAKIGIIEGLKKRREESKNSILEEIYKRLKVVPEEGLPERLYLSAGEILDMSSGGIDFGSHGVSHAILTKLDIEDARKEARESKICIENLLSKKIEAFSYPNGTTADFNGRVIDAVKEAGYKAAFSTVPGINKNGRGLNHFAIKRIAAGRSFMQLRKNLLLAG